MPGRRIAIATALALFCGVGIAQAGASTLTAGIRAAATAASTAPVGHACGGYWRVKRCWVPPKYHCRPIYRCGRFLGYKKVIVRQGFWKRYRHWVRCHCRL